MLKAFTSMKGIKLGFDSTCNTCLFLWSAGFKFGIQKAVDSVIESWNRWEDCWFENLSILSELGHVTAVESDTQSINVGGTLQNLLKRVSCWQIRYVGITTIKLFEFSIHLSPHAKCICIVDEHFVGQLDTFRVASCSRSVAQHEGVCRFWFLD